MKELIESYKTKLRDSDALLEMYDVDTIERTRVVTKRTCYRKIISELETEFKKRFFVVTGNEFGVELTSIEEIVEEKAAIVGFDKASEEAEATVLCEIIDDTIRIVKIDKIF